MMDLTHIIVTAPHESVAVAYQRQLSVLKESIGWLRRCHVLCISDPCGHRIGSGGGTLNAINAVVSSFPKESLVGHKVAIIHSGGDSQRSPLHSVCGKAWATINTYPDSSVVRDSSDGYSTAFSLILTQLNLVARTLHPNSIMVSCSDVILNLGMISSDLGEDGSSVPVDCVCVVCLPEVLSVATNHGCLCVETEQTSGRGPEASRVYVKPVHQYYQKPSIDVLRRHCLYSCGATADEMTLIDSGITVFQGTAVECLFGLLDDLHELYGPAGGADKAQWLGRPYLCTARLELYSDMLLACRTGAAEKQHESRGGSFDDQFRSYASTMLGDTGSAAPLLLAVFRKLYSRLHCVPFMTIIAPKGTFGHLGTSVEWLQLVSSTNCAGGDSGPASEATDPFREKCRVFAQIYRLQDAVHACLLTSCDAVGAGGAAPLCVVNSLVGERVQGACSCAPRPGCKLCGPGAAAPSAAVEGKLVQSFIEHSVLTGDTSVGAHCIVSHVLSAGGGGGGVVDNLGHDLHLCDHMMLQTVPVDCRCLVRAPGHYPNVAEASAQHAVLLLGLLDNVKLPHTHAGATYCNVAWRAIFELLGAILQPDDIWPGASTDEAELTLWDAELFVVTGNGSESSNLRDSFDVLWWQELPGVLEDPDCAASGRLAALRDAAAVWKAAPRLSLRQVLRCGLADSMFEWRHFLTKVVAEMQVAATAGGSSISSLPQPCPSATGAGCRYSGSENFLREMCSDFRLVQDSARRCCGGASRTLWSMCLLAAWWCNLCDLDATVSGGIVRQCAGAEMGSEELDQCQALFRSLYDRGGSWDPALVLFAVLHHVPRLQVLRMLPVLLRSVRAEPAAVRAENQSRAFLVLSSVCDHFRLAIDRQSADRVSSALLRHVRSAVDGGGPTAAWIELGGRVGSFVAEAAEIVQEALAVQVDCGGFAAEGDAVALGPVLEACAQKIMAQHIDLSLQEIHPEIGQQASMADPPAASAAAAASSPPSSASVSSVARAPVRIDLTGGWSDTPPICYELGGAVLNLGVRVAGVHPVTALCRLLPPVAGEAPVVRLESLRLDAAASGYLSEAVCCRSYEELAHQMDNPQSDQCALLKAVVFVALGLPLPGAADAGFALPGLLQTRFGGCGLELVSRTALPSGSGLGGSSVLAAAALRAVEHLLASSEISSAAAAVQDEEARLRLSARVSKVEQIMTTGGGWQDQIGAIFPGLKLATSARGLPLQVQVEPFSFGDAALDAQFARLLGARTFLVYTGRQRLARNCLMNALKRSAATPHPGQEFAAGGSSSTIAMLAAEARELMLRLCQQRAAVLGEGAAISSDADVESAMNAMIDDIGATLTRYWRHKRCMAGGAEPHFVSALFRAVDPVCCGYSLCGAGGGGFAAVILKQDCAKPDLVQCLHPLRAASGSSPRGGDFDEYGVLDVEVDTAGIVVEGGAFVGIC